MMLLLQALKHIQTIVDIFYFIATSYFRNTDVTFLGQLHFPESSE